MPEYTQEDRDKIAQEVAIAGYEGFAPTIRWWGPPEKKLLKYYPSIYRAMTCPKKDLPLLINHGDLPSRVVARTRLKLRK